MREQDNKSIKKMFTEEAGQTCRPVECSVSMLMNTLCSFPTPLPTQTHETLLTPRSLVLYSHSHRHRHSDLHSSRPFIIFSAAVSSAAFLHAVIKLSPTGVSLGPTYQYVCTLEDLPISTNVQSTYHYRLQSSTHLSLQGI